MREQISVFFQGSPDGTMTQLTTEVWNAHEALTSLRSDFLERVPGVEVSDRGNNTLMVIATTWVRDPGELFTALNASLETLSLQGHAW